MSESLVADIENIQQPSVNILRAAESTAADGGRDNTLLKRTHFNDTISKEGKKVKKQQQQKKKKPLEEQKLQQDLERSVQFSQNQQQQQINKSNKHKSQLANSGKNNHFQPPINNQKQYRSNCNNNNNNNINAPRHHHLHHQQHSGARSAGAPLPQNPGPFEFVLGPADMHVCAINACNVINMQRSIIINPALQHHLEIVAFDIDRNLHQQMHQVYGEQQCKHQAGAQQQQQSQIEEIVVEEAMMMPEEDQVTLASS